MTKLNQIKLGALFSYISIGINILAGMLYTPWMIQQIGKSDYGLYTLANSLISLFLIDFGLSAATARYVSKYVAEKKQDKANSFIGTVYKLYLFVDAIIFIALIAVYFCIDIIYVKLTPTELEKFKVVYSIAALYSVVNFPFVTLNGILTAYEKFVQLKIAEIIYRILIVGLTVWALLSGMGLYALVTVNAVSGLVIIAYKFFVIKKTIPMKPAFKKSDKGVYKTIFTFSLWTTISSLAQRLILNITPTILGIVSSTTAIAIFGVIHSIDQYVYTFANAINGMFMPKISRIYANNNDNDILPLMIKVGRFQFALNGLIIAGFLVLGQSFIYLWMGNDYADAYIGILCIAVPGLFYNPLQIANTAMIVKNKIKEQAYIAILMGVFNVVCSFILSSYFGVLGACVSIFLACILRDVLYHIVLKKIMKIDIIYFMKKCYLKMLPPVVFAVIAGIFLNFLIITQTWAIFAIKVMIFCAVYIISILLVGLTKEERESLISHIKRDK